MDCKKSHIYIYKMSQYFPTPQELSGRNIKIESDISKYEAKTNLKEAKNVDTANLESKLCLASSKTEVHKIDLDKLKTFPVDLSKLSKAVNNDIVNNTIYDKLIKKIFAVDTGVISSNRIISKTQFDSKRYWKKIKNFDKKISNTSGLVKKTDLNKQKSYRNWKQNMQCYCLN